MISLPKRASLFFQPQTVPGTYEIYYLPAKFRKGWDDARYGPPWNDFLPPTYETDAGWEKDAKINADVIPEAKVIRFEARMKFDFFTPMSIEINGLQILNQHISFVVETERGNIVFTAENMQAEKIADGLVQWNASSEQGGLKFNCSAYMEYDGYVRYHVKVSAENDYKPAPPKVWENSEKGTISLSGLSNQPAGVVSSTGNFTLSANPLDFEFALMCSTETQRTQSFTETRLFPFFVKIMKQGYLFFLK